MKDGPRRRVGQVTRCPLRDTRILENGQIDITSHIQQPAYFSRRVVVVNVQILSAARMLPAPGTDAALRLENRGVVGEVDAVASTEAVLPLSQRVRAALLRCGRLVTPAGDARQFISVPTF